LIRSGEEEGDRREAGGRALPEDAQRSGGARRDLAPRPGGSPTWTLTEEEEDGGAPAAAGPGTVVVVEQRRWMTRLLMLPAVDHLISSIGGFFFLLSLSSLGLLFSHTRIFFS